MSVSYDSLVDRYRLSRRQLETECLFGVRFTIANKLTHWRNVAPHLLAERWEQIAEEIEHELGPGDEMAKRHLLLQRWKEIYGSEATHEQLIRALLSAERTDLAEVACGAVGESYSSQKLATPIVN